MNFCDPNAVAIQLRERRAHVLELRELVRQIEIDREIVSHRRWDKSFEKLDGLGGGLHAQPRLWLKRHHDVHARAFADARRMFAAFQNVRRDGVERDWLERAERNAD